MSHVLYYILKNSVHITLYIKSKKKTEIYKISENINHFLQILHIFAKLFE